MFYIYLLIISLITNNYVFPQDAEPDRVSTFTVKASVTDYEPGKTVYFALYKSQKDLDSKKFYRKVRFPGNRLPSDTLHVIFRDVEPGEYIIAGYQDINGDGKLNMGLFGPEEPFRVYKPVYRFFAPKFKKCKFTVSGNIDGIIIRLK